MKEGSRHEKAGLVISAYVIGFVTAFIGYGINTMTTTDIASSLMSTNNTASLSSAATARPKVEEREDGLYYVVGRHERLLSIRDLDLAQTAPQDGIYTALTMYETSPDGQYVYYCEEPLVDSENCAPYVYSAANDSVYPVTQDGERIAMPAKKHKLEWTDRGLEAIAGIRIDLVR